jgi:hypothetical protein
MTSEFKQMNPVTNDVSIGGRGPGSYQISSHRERTDVDFKSAIN